MSYIEKLKSKKADISVFYKKVCNLKLPLQVFLPENFDKTNKYKTIIAIHGGGWLSLKETPNDWDGGWMANNAKYYAEKGYVSIVFSYRDINLLPYGDVGDLLRDCRDAIKYIRDNFSFVDAQNVLMMGDSAGGHIALCLSMGLPDGEKAALKPKEIVAYNPVVDCVSDKWSYCAVDAVKYSPMHNIKRIDAEILVMHGDCDTVVSIEDSRIFTRKMKNAGNDISMIEIEGAEHAFILFGYKAKDEDVFNALKLTDEYFNL